MSKYSHYEMCEKIFGKRYKNDPRTGQMVCYSRTDMWNKLMEFKEEIDDLKAQTVMYNELLKLHREYNEEVGRNVGRIINDYESKLAEKDEEIRTLRNERRSSRDRFSDDRRTRRSSGDRRLDMIEQFFDKLLAEFDSK